MWMVTERDRQVEPEMFVQLVSGLIAAGKTAEAGAELSLQSLETVCSLDHLPKQQQGVVHSDPHNPRDLSSLSDSDTSHAPTQSAQQGVWIHGNDANPKGMRCCR